MKRWIWVCLAAVGCSDVGQRIEIDHQGRVRNYYLVVPPRLDPDAPLVLTLHGGGNKGANKGRRLGLQTGMAKKAHRARFVAAFPSSWRGNWNDGRKMERGYVDPDVDDVGFISAVVDDVAERADIDRSRVYLAGISNGGFMTQRVICERSERFAAGVSVVGTMPANLECDPSLPMPVLFMLGTEDPIVRWAGGDVGEGGRGKSLSADEAVAFWVKQNGCTGGPEVNLLPDRAEDSTRVRGETWTGCTAPVGRLVVEGGGHVWPGGNQYLPASVVGRATRDVHGADVLWGFVRDQRRSISETPPG